MSPGDWDEDGPIARVLDCLVLLGVLLVLALLAVGVWRLTERGCAAWTT